MARTYDTLVAMVKSAKPELANVRIPDLVKMLDEHFPIEGGWRTKPLQEGPALLRKVIEEQAKTAE